MNLARWYCSVGRWIFRSPLQAAAIALCCAVLGAWGATHLKIKADLQDLLPPEFESVRGLKELQEKYGGLSYLMLGFDVKEADDAIRFMEALSPELAALPLVQHVSFQRPVEFFQQKFPLYLEKDDLTEIERRLRRKREAMRHGASPVFDHLFFSLDGEELAFDDIVAKYEKRLNLDPFSTKYYQNETGTFFALLIKPSTPNVDLEASRSLVADVERAVEGLAPAQFGQGVRVLYGGDYRKIIEQEAHLKAEIGSISAAVMALLMLILILYYRRLSPIIIIGLPLAAGISCTGGVVALCFGHINLVTGFSAAVLAGLGSDYGIYLLSRFFQERAAGRSLREAYQKTFWHMNRATRGSAITTIIAFAVLAFSQFKGFSEFGVIGVIGLLFNVVFMYVLFPALLVLCDRLGLLRWEERLFPWSLRSRFQREWQRLAFFWIILFSALGLVSAMQLSKMLHVEYALSDLENTDLPSYQDDLRINALFQSSLHPSVLIVPTEEDERKVLAAVEALREQPLETPMIRGGVGLSSFIPALQEEKQGSLLRIQRLLSTMRLPSLAEHQQLLQGFLASSWQEPITASALPPEVTRLFATTSISDRAIFIFSEGSRDTTKKIVAFADQISGIAAAAGSRIAVASDVLIVADILVLVEREGLWIVSALFLLMFVYLAFEFRRISEGLMLVGLLLSVLVLLGGGMAAFGMRLNIFNLIAIPIILGTGCDSFLHFYHRAKEERRRVVETVNIMAPSILVANLTTMVGFGGLIATDYGALRSLGWTVVLGMVVVTATALLFFPALLIIAQQLRGKRARHLASSVQIVTKTP